MTQSPLPLSTRFLDEMLAEFPDFRIVPKASSGFSVFIDRLLKLVTLGGQRRYLTHYHTVIGSTLYVPESWVSLGDIDRVILLRHERVHLRQRRRMTFLGMAFVYLVPILPLGLAYGRARLEWEAYAETLRATAELRGIDAASSTELRDQIVSRFVGPDYGWMWPFPSCIDAWYERALADIRGGEGPK